jgi:hypothetical protein
MRFLAVCVGMMLVATLTRAQTIVISDGGYAYDGRSITLNDHQADLLNGLQLSLSFSGNALPMVRWKGQVFELRPDGLYTSASPRHARSRLDGAGAQRTFDAGVTFATSRGTIHTRDVSFRLERERFLDARSIALGAEIKQLPPGTQRNAVEAELIRVLNQAFDLKQANRRAEIKSLVDRLDALEYELLEREQYRDDIIMRRVEHLTGIRE